MTSQNPLSLLTAMAGGNLPGAANALVDPFQLLRQMTAGAVGASGISMTSRITETDTAVEVAFELPDLEEDNIRVSVADGQLTVKAGRRSATQANGPGLQISNSSYSVAQHTMSLLAGVDPDVSVVRYQNGVLTVTLPKKA